MWKPPDTDEIIQPTNQVTPIVRGWKPPPTDEIVQPIQQPQQESWLGNIKKDIIDIAPKVVKGELGKNVVSGLQRQAVGIPKTIGDILSYIPKKGYEIGRDAAQTLKENKSVVAPNLKWRVLGEKMLHPIQGFKQLQQPAVDMATDIIKFGGQLAKRPVKIAFEQPVETGMLVAPLIPKIAKIGNIFSDVGNIDKSISRSWTKAIKPSVSGKRTLNQIEKYNSEAVKAVKIINENKNNLGLVDDYGIAKIQPENLYDLSKSIQTSKDIIFNKYNDLQLKSTGNSVKVDLKPIADEVIRGVTSKEVQTLYPKLRDYALEKAEALKTTKVFTPQEAQNAVKMLNADLEAFYKNPTSELAQKSVIDATISNNLRRSLDNAIETGGGSGYQELRNQYKALKTVEKDVNNRLVFDARKSSKGFFDLSDIYTAPELIRGLLTMNPASIIKGGLGMTLKMWYKHINNPNTIIKNMFNDVSKKQIKAIKTIPTKNFKNTYLGTKKPVKKDITLKDITQWNKPKERKFNINLKELAERTPIDNVVFNPMRVKSLNKKK